MNWGQENWVLLVFKINLCNFLRDHVHLDQSFENFYILDISVLLIVLIISLVSCNILCCFCHLLSMYFFYKGNSAYVKQIIII